MSETPHVGSTVLHYRVLRVIGSGGMGVVYEAEDTKLGRRVALKFLPPSLVRDRAALERFEREARAASALNHPNICTIYAIEQWNDEHFIAMELLDGEPIDRRIVGGAQSWESVIEIGAQVADALEAAHQRSIVHRDIKPANIFVTRTGTAKVLDFGVAKVASGHGSDAETVRVTTPNAQLTGPGVAVGTIAYMSPEQARGDDVDARSDLFSLAAVLYEMATGRPAFRGKTSAVIFQQILGVTPDPPRTVNPALPPKLDEIILKGLEKDRELRYQTAGELRADLKRLKRDTSASSGAVAAAAPPSRTAKILGLAVIAAIGIALVSGIVLYKLLSHEGTPPPAADGVAMTVQRLTNGGDIRGCGSMSPDGKAVAYCDFAGKLYVQQVATGAKIAIGDGNGATTFSPDGNYVFLSGPDAQHPGGALTRIPTFGGEARIVLTNLGGAVGISPDGNRIAFLRFYPAQREVALMIADTAGGNERQLLTTSLDSTWFDEPGVSWSMDGKWISATQTSIVGGFQMRPVVIDAATGRLSVLGSQTWAEVGRTAWLPGNRVVFAARERPMAPAQYWIASYPDGPARRITNDSRGFGNMSLGVTADGATIATVPTDVVSNIWATNGDATAPLEQWTSGLRRDGNESLWPTADGRVYYGSSDGTEIGIWTSSGPGQRTLAQREADYPSLPADGRFIVYLSLHEGRVRVFRVDSDGTQARVLTRGEDDWSAIVSPDGHWIYYASMTGLMRMPATGGDAVKIAAPDTVVKDVSPDGERLLVWMPADSSSPGGHAILAADTGVLKARLDLRGSMPRWGRRPDLIAYLSTTDGVTNLWERPFSGGTPRQLTKFTTGSTFNFAYSPDRKRLFLARGTRTGDLYLIKNFQ